MNLIFILIMASFIVGMIKPEWILPGKSTSRITILLILFWATAIWALINRTILKSSGKLHKNKRGEKRAAVKTYNARNAETRSHKKLNDPEAVKAIIQDIEPKNTAARMAAIKTLIQKPFALTRKEMAELLQNVSDLSVLESIVEKLDASGWEPEHNQSGAMYWALKGEWIKCLEMGATAIKPLILIGPDNNTIENICDTLAREKPDKAKKAYKVYLEYLHDQFEKVQKKVRQEETGWGGSTFPDYHNRDIYQLQADEISKEMIRIKKKLD